MTASRLRLGVAVLAWWLPGHVLLSAGIGAATVVGALPARDVAARA